MPAMLRYHEPELGLASLGRAALPGAFWEPGGCEQDRGGVSRGNAVPCSVRRGCSVHAAASMGPAACCPLPVPWPLGAHPRPWPRGLLAWEAWDFPGWVKPRDPSHTGWSLSLPGPQAPVEHLCPCRP